MVKIEAEMIRPAFFGVTNAKNFYPAGGTCKQAIKKLSS